MSRYIVASSDWHLWKKHPVSRIDKQYFENGLDKVKQIIDIANDRDAIICIAGDIYDHIDVTPYMINALSDVLDEACVPIFAVAGQHDMHNRLLDQLCPYNTLRKFGNIIHLTNKPAHGLYGISFNEAPRLDITETPVALVLHKTITEKKPPFFLKTAMSADDVMEKFSKFPIIISGDYHVPFVRRNKNQVLVNCGVLMRKEVTLMDYIPGVYVIDTHTLKVTRVPLKVLPKKDVFNINSVKAGTDVHEEMIIGDTGGVVSLLKKAHMRPSYANIINALAAQQGYTHTEIALIADILKVAELNGK